MKIDWLEKQMLVAENMITENQVDEGLVILNELLYDEPGYAGLHNHLGWAYMYYTANSARAELHLTMATKFAADFAPAYLHLAALQVRMENFDAAIEVATKGLNVKSANRVALLEQIAIAYELKRNYRLAIRSFKEALLSSVGHETSSLTAAIKRCRKKRLAVMFTF